MVGVNTDEQWMIFPQHRAQTRRNALRKEDGNPRADSQKLDVRNCSQLAQQKLKFFVAKKERVTPAEQHVANRRRLANVIDLALELGMEIIAGGIADESGTSAVTAIGRAAVG